MATETEIRRRLAEYRAAESAVLRNQSYTIGTRTFTRPNLRWLQEEIRKLESALKGVTGGSIRVNRVVFRDD